MKKRKRKMESQFSSCLSNLASSNRKHIPILTFATLFLFALLALICPIDCDSAQSAEHTQRPRAQFDDDGQNKNHLLNLAGVAIINNNNHSSTSRANGTNHPYAISTQKLSHTNRITSNAFPESTNPTRPQTRIVDHQPEEAADENDLLAVETSNGPKLLAIGSSTNKEQSQQAPYASSQFQDAQNRHQQHEISSTNQTLANLINSTIPWRPSNGSQLVKLYRASPWPLAVQSESNLRLNQPLLTGNHLLAPKQLIGPAFVWPPANLASLRPTLQPISVWPAPISSSSSQAAAGRQVNETFPFVLPKFSTSTSADNETRNSGNHTDQQTTLTKTNEHSRGRETFTGEREEKFPSLISSIEASPEDEFERTLSVGNYQRTNMASANNLSWSELLKKASESNIMESLMVTNRSMVSLLCDTNSMLLRFKFKQAFHGLVMTNLDPFKSCRLIGTGGHYYEMRISLTDCGTRQEMPKLFVNNIQIQFNERKRISLSELDLIEEQEVKTIICSYPIRPRAPPPPDLGLRSGSLPERIVEAAPSEPAKLVYYEPLVLISALLLLSLTLLGLTTSAYLFTKRAGRHQSRGLASSTAGASAWSLYRAAPAQSANRLMAPPLIWGSPASKVNPKLSRAGRPMTSLAPVRQGSDKNRKEKEAPALVTVVKSLPPEFATQFKGREYKSGRSRDSLAPDRDSRDSVTTIEIPYSPQVNHHPATNNSSLPEKATGGGRDLLKVNLPDKPKTKVSSNSSLVVPRFGSLRKTLTSPEEFKRLQEIARLFGEILIEKRIEEGDERGTKIVYKSRLSPSKYSGKILNNLDEIERRKVRKALCNDELLRSFVVESTDRETFRRKLRFNPHYASKFKPNTWELLEEILLDSEISSSQTSSNSVTSTNETEENESEKEEEMLKSSDELVTINNIEKKLTPKEHSPGQKTTNRVGLIESFGQTDKLITKEEPNVESNEPTKVESLERDDRENEEKERESVLLESNARQEDIDLQSDADSLEMRAAIETRMVSNANREANGGEQLEQVLQLSEDTSSKAVVRVSQFNSTHMRTREGGMSGTLINIDHVINYTTNFG